MKSIKLATYLKQIKNLPEELKIMDEGRECLKCGQVKKRKAGRIQDKDRLFYLFNDYLIYCTINNNYKGMIPCDLILIRNINDNQTQFHITTIKPLNFQSTSSSNQSLNSASTHTLYASTLTSSNLPSSNLRSNSFVQHAEDKCNYTITTESPVEKQDWLLKFHAAFVFYSFSFISFSALPFSSAIVLPPPPSFLPSSYPIPHPYPHPIPHPDRKSV